jgi:hypothetical protein
MAVVRDLFSLSSTNLWHVSSYAGMPASSIALSLFFADRFQNLFNQGLASDESGFTALDKIGNHLILYDGFLWPGLDGSDSNHSIRSA